MGGDKQTSNHGVNKLSKLYQSMRELFRGDFLCVFFNLKKNQPTVGNTAGGIDKQRQATISEVGIKRHKRSHWI